MKLATPNRATIAASTAAAPADLPQKSLLFAVPILVATVWSYWPTLSNLWREWQNDPNYSAGQLVPLAAVYVIWARWKSLSKALGPPCWWGIGLILLAEIARLLGLLFLYESGERYAFLLSLAGLTLLVGGRRLFWEARWILVFLVLMVPFPGKLHNLISGRLQDGATSGAVFTLELLGVDVLREGHVLVLNGATPVAVAEACSGLRMLTAFIMVAAVMAFLVERSVWQRATLVISSIPVAIICNLIRLVVTALLFMWTDSATAELFLHDFAGVLMMPLAVAMLIGELSFLRQLFPPESPKTTRTPTSMAR